MEARALKIGVIGAGFIAQAVGRIALGAGYDVMLSNSRGTHSLADVAADVGCRTGSVADAEAFSDLVLVAIPFGVYRSIPATALLGKVVLDATNYYPGRDGRFLQLDFHASTTSELLAAHLQGARVVKSFNSILARDIVKDARPAYSPERRALPIAGDDPEAKQVVTAFHHAVGYDVVDAGPLAEGRRFQRARPCYCRPFDTAGLALALQDRGPDVAEGSWRK